ncbi:hypothetical protein U1620_17930, partial [Aeromonas caviae]
TEYPWSACQKAPSVTVTWGWGSCGLMVDLGNSADIKQLVESCGGRLNLFVHMPDGTHHGVKI